MSEADESKGRARSPETLPSALRSLDEIRERMRDKRLAVFLDYDGTLTPIVSRPDQAVLSEEMRQVVTRLAELCAVGVISGRDLQDVRRLVGIESIYYAGSHGFDITGPDGKASQAHEGDRFLPELDAVERELRDELADIEGALLERKKFSIAVHYRQVDDERVGDVETVVDRILDGHSGVRKTYGKRVFDLQPNIDWNKGKALLHVLSELGLDEADVLPMYLGDDVTDEDAFEVLRGRGVAIYVLDGSHETTAAYTLENADEVGRFLQALSSILGGEG